MACSPWFPPLACCSSYSLSLRLACCQRCDGSGENQRVNPDGLPPSGLHRPVCMRYVGRIAVEGHVVPASDKHAVRNPAGPAEMDLCGKGFFQVLVLLQARASVPGGMCTILDRTPAMCRNTFSIRTDRVHSIYTHIDPIRYLAVSRKRAMIPLQTCRRRSCIAAAFPDDVYIGLLSSR